MFFMLFRSFENIETYYRFAGEILLMEMTTFNHLPTFHYYLINAGGIKLSILLLHFLVILMNVNNMR